jgi:hypothetical protein
VKIILKSRWIGGENVILSACPVSEALFELLENRKTLRAKDLRLIAKMGFNIELIGDTQPLINEMSNSGIEFKLKDGKVTPKIEV